MLGEEQEQVFSYMARLGATTKHQSKVSKLLVVGRLFYF
jgi:hypothetical protein